MDNHNLSIQLYKTREEFAAAQEAEMALIEGLGNNILKHLGNIELGIPIKIFMRSSASQVVAGLTATVFGGWMYISLLWVEESLRNQGYGTRLVQMAEAEAISLGCQHAHVDTYSFEAKPFYDRLGYETFATLDDYPKSYCKYFMKKQLVS
ncbi:MAG: GNAT family N-acetyltransferase [Anaerolineales bacterium]|nr:GNAT family N-acetyltransferase [Anaerolineales bacterium]